MKFRQSLVLLVVLCILVALYAAMQYRRQHQSEAVLLSRQLFSFAPTDVQRLSIRRIAEDASVAERVSPAEWRIVEPNPTILPFHLMWNRVAEHLSTLSNEHTVMDSPGELAAYGLDTPALEVKADLANGDAIRLDFGDIEPTQRYRYAQMNGGPMFLVRTDAFFELDRSLKDLRHRYLVDDREKPLMRMEFAWIWTDPPKEEDGRRIETGDEALTIVVERETAEAPWRVTAPYQALARYEKVQALATELQFAVCKDYIDHPENLADYGLQPAHARISFQDNLQGGKRTIWVGDADTSPDKKGLFVKAEGQDAVLVVENPLLNLLPTTPTEWRDLRLLTRRVSEIKEVTYTRGADRFVLVKDAEGAWSLREPVLEASNVFAVNAFLSFIKEVEGADFVEDPAAGSVLENPEAMITLHFEDDSTSEIRLAPKPDAPDTYYASQDSGGIVSLTGVAVNMLLLNNDTFRSLEMLRFSKPDVQELAVLFEEREYRIVRRHDAWAATVPENFQLKNQADVETLLDAVNPLNAMGLEKEIVEDADLKAWGLNPPVFTLRLQVKGQDAQDQQITLDIGAVNPKNPSERFARSTLRQGVFRISQQVMDKVREALRGFL